MQCPKCGHTQSGEDECSSCGVVFAKLARIQAKMGEADKNTSDVLKLKAVPPASQGDFILTGI